MVKRGTERSQGKQNKKTQTKKKKKLTCCQRCCRRIRRRICRRIKRCIKRKVFGSPDPHLDDYDLAGYNLGSIRDMFKRNKNKRSQDLNDEDKKSVISLFRNKNLKSYKEAITDELDRYSLMDFDNRWSMHSLMDSIKSKLNLKSKERLSKLYTDFKTDSKLLKNLSATELKKKFSVTGSKQIIFNKMLEDYKRGKVDLAKLKTVSKLDIENLDRDKFNKLLEDYENTQRTNKIKKLFKKMSTSGYEQAVLKRMKEDLINNKLSLTFLKKLSKLDVRKIDMKKFRDIIKDYKNKLKKSNTSLFQESKLEKFRLFVKSKFLDKFRNT